ncbi:MAG: tetratricopeptide repeat protein [Bacteroidia bacterium]|nr:tetratricopeptide repeat protein [Bacteroidia bacterium]
MKKKIKTKAEKKTLSQAEHEGRQKIRYVIFIAAAAFILYGNTIKNDYSFDDIYVTNNQEVKLGFSAIPKMFTSLYANMYEDGKPLTFGYRPVVKATFAIEYGCFGSNPHISHLINLLLYAFSGILLYLLLRRLLKGYNDLFPLIITLLFMGHPAHTEVVSSLKNRDELISFLSCIGSLHLFIDYIEKNKLQYLIGAFLIYIVGYLAKPTVVIFMAIYPLVFFFFTDARFWKIFLIIAAVFVITYLAKTVPRMYLPGPERPIQFIENPLVFQHNPLIRIATGFYVMLFYMKQVIFPHPLLFYYGYNMIPIVGFSNIWALISVVIHVALFVIAIFFIKKKHILSFGIIIYLVSVGTFSNILKPAMGIVADRFLYFPSFGFSILLTYFIFVFSGTHPKVFSIPSSASSRIIIAVSLIFVLYASKTIIRNNDWKTQITLLNADIGRLDKSARANLIYAGTMKGELLKKLKKKVDFDPKPEIDSVFNCLNNAIKVYPDYYQAYNMRGSIYLSFFKDYQNGLSDFLASIKIKPGYIPAYFSIAYCYDKLNETDKAIQYYKKSIELEPGNLQANVNLTKIYRNQGDYEDALFYNSKARSIKDSLDNLKQLRKAGK